MDTIGKSSLLSTWNQFCPLVFGKMQFFGEFLDNISNFYFTGGGMLEHRKHEELVVRNRHRRNLLTRVANRVHSNGS